MEDDGVLLGNLTPDQMTLIRGRRYNRTKRNREANLVQNAPKGQNVLSEASNQNTATTLAAQHGVTERTIRRDGADAELLDRHLQGDSPGSGSRQQPSWMAS